MRILCTGAGGYIGSVLVPHLLHCGHHVVALDTYVYGINSLAACCHDPRFTPVRGDARDQRVLKLLLANADAIIPLAAIVGMQACAADENAALTTNYGAVKTLCDLASSFQRIVFPNTNSGYGIGSDAECTEDSPLNPVSLYGKLKVAAEEIVMARPNSIAFRLATVFGASPRMRVDLLLNDFVHRAVHDRALVVFEGRFRRNFLHVRDAASAFQHAIQNFDSMRGRVYNVGDSRTNMTKLDLCRRIETHVPGFVWMEAEHHTDVDKRDYVVSNARIEATGWRPERSLDEGISELCKLYTTIKDRRFGNAT